MEKKSKSTIHQKGAALVIVLFMVAIMMAIVISMLLLSRSELRSADTYSSQIQSSTLAELTTNLAISQIRGATNSLGGESWASQPGAIRRYGSDGDFIAGFKLYSDDDMVITTENSFLDDLPPNDWLEQDEHFVDMNEPIVTELESETKVLFPIIDPRAEDEVEGFSFVDAVNGGIEGTINSDDDDARLPMPVRWLYVLQDGTTGHLDEASGDFVGNRADGSPVIPDQENPIVGRVAFWTDDESSKININTASEPTFWDTPRSVSREDLWYARSQPSQREFQRYPGHPATTALSPVLFGNEIIRETQGQLEANNQEDTNVDIKEAIYDLIPRVNIGGSKSGTVTTQSRSEASETDEDRLYTSVDEFIFSAPRLAQVSGGVRPQSDVVDRDLLERSRFFLTAHSRAPELNLFGLPRVSIWPTDDDSKTSLYRSHFDELIRFCSTSPAGHQYFFTRKNADSPFDDWNDITRNQQVYEYLSRLTAESIPGVGRSLASKFGDDREQILTECFDYIRATNLADDTHPTNATRFTDARNTVGHGQVTPIQINDTMGFGRFATFSEFAMVFICNADPKVDTQMNFDSVSRVLSEGDTNFDSVGENERVVEMLFVPEAFIPGQGWSAYKARTRVVIQGLDNLRLDGQQLYTNSSVSYIVNNSIGGGFHGREWAGSVGFRGMVNDQLISEKVKVQVDDTNDTQTMPFSQTGDITVTIYSGNNVDPNLLVQTIKLNFPNAEFPVPELQTTGTISGNGSTQAPKEDWWELTTRIGRRGRNPGAPWTSANNNHPETDTRNPVWQTGVLEGGVFRPGDVVRCMMPFHRDLGGDYRLVAMTKEIESNVFLPHSGYYDVDQPIDHTLNLPAGAHYYYGFGNADLHDTADGLYRTYSYTVNTQLTDAEYHLAKFPDYPRGYATGVDDSTDSTHITTGDFDNGVAMVPDGAYVNKPDGGNIHANFFSRTPRMFDEPVPYFDRNWVQNAQGPAFFSPNRQISSAVMFGSLPTGVKREQAWQTLLFRPQLDHPGFEDPKDHYLLDLFWMPVVEPYAISEPFSTAGKINLNYQILPFTNITRATGIHALMKAEEMLIVKDGEAAHYKNFDHALADYHVPAIPDEMRWRQLINIDETLKQFENRFLNGEIFRSGSEICDVHLIPMAEDNPITLTGDPADSGFQANVNRQMRDFWAAHSPTGDNVRERPYSNIYPRVTTKSNTFRVHCRAQVLKKSRQSEPDTFDPDLDSVSGEWRGSNLIERFIDPGNEEIPDYATITDIGSQSLDRYYRFRIIYRQRFN